MVSWPLSRPTITPHLIPLISAFIKSPRGRGRVRKGGDESGRESASLIKAKQAANRCPPSLPPHPTNICPRNNYTSIPSASSYQDGFLLEHRGEERKKGEFALAGSREPPSVFLANPSLCSPL